MNSYSTYKASGIEWLGDIPEHWQVNRIINVSKIANGSTPKSNVDEYWEGDITWVTPGDISKLNGYIFESERMITQSGYDSCGTVMVSQNSTVITCRAPIGNTVIVGKELCTNQGCKSLIPLKIEYRYLYYFILNANEEITSLGQGTTFLELSRTSLGNTKISFPNSLPEQTAIANYLDEKTNKLDQLIKNKKAQIAQLKELRQIEINTAVTKGLNPNVNLKPSGIEWLGDIPEHWELKRFRYCFKNSKGLSITKQDLLDKGIPCVSYGEIHSKFGFEVDPDKNSLSCVREEYLETNASSLLVNGDFVFADTSEDIEGAGNFTHLCSTKKVFAGYHTVISRLSINAYPKYVAYVLDSLAYRTQIRRKVQGVKVYSITNKILKDTILWLPEPPEQTAIANYLDEKTTKLDQLINNKKAQIAQLKEIRQIEIFNAVTGKIKVA